MQHWNNVREMSHYISDDVVDRETRAYVSGYNSAIADVLLVIDDAPAIDPESLRARGRWVRGNESQYSPLNDSYSCSVCGDPAVMAFGKPARTKYCPSCGARMKGAEDGTTD